MASKNTSKTAHVMNLLSKNRVPDAETPEEPIISPINADAAVSSQIKDALEAELGEGSQAAPVRRAAPVQQAAPAQQAAPVQQAAPAQQTASVQQAAPVQAAPQAPAPAEEPPQAPMDLPAPQPEAPYINVMQILVEEKADEYMRMFGICCCDKCRVDVRAYALNHLPPKYVVLSEHERIPRLTVYESRFSSDITAQLIKACKQVMFTPHHTREGG